MVKKGSAHNYKYTQNYDKGPIYNTCNSYASDHNAWIKRVLAYSMLINFGVSRTILNVVRLYVFPSFFNHLRSIMSILKVIKVLQQCVN